MSARTLGLHYGRHHAGYVNTLNRLTAATPYAGQSLVRVIRASAPKATHRAIFNAAAQAWNHEFFWKSIRPRGASGARPAGALAKRIRADIGDSSDLVAAFVDAGQAQFGSGWVWLVAAGRRLKVLATAGAEPPWLGAGVALLAIDVWEHAYYLDYQHRRPAFLATVARKLLNWEFAAENFAAIEPGRRRIGPMLDP
jgi:Fe-Mn family superoxide dismutase